MKVTVVIFLSAWLAFILGCATSTIEKRKHERYGAYSSLSEESRSFVDVGRIQIGMSMDAVYIAWGKPSEILEGQSSQGSIITWLYYGTHFEEIRYWSHRPAPYSYHGYYEPYLRYDYYPREYVQAEVNFENGVVKNWQMLPRPTY